MAGITTSDMLNGEQPKADGLGSRVDELTAEVGELRKQFALLRCHVTDQFEAIEKKREQQLFDEVCSIIGKIDGLNDRLEKIEEKNNDE